MDSYKSYAENLQGLDKTLTGILGLKLSYIKSKGEGLDTYTNYLSSKFFPKKDKLSKYDITERINIIESALQEFDSVEKKIQADQNIDSDLKSFLLKMVNETSIKAKVAKRSTLFEAEKSGYDIRLEGSMFEIKKNPAKIKNIGLGNEYNKKKQSYIEEINHLQTEAYGPKISNCDDEKTIILSMCNGKYQKNKNRLTQKENDLFSSFLTTFKENISNKISQDKKKLPERGKLSMSTIMEGTEHIKQHFYEDINQRPQKKEKGKTGYAVPFSSKVREYPDKDQDLFNKILTTIGHEDGGHMIRSDNQEKNGMIVVGSGYENIEEGITKLNEGLLKYSLDDYPLIPNDTFIAVFIGENYNFEDTYHLIKAWKKLNAVGEITKEKEASISKIAFNLAQRVKCYYPWDEKGSNRKDVIYFRGEKKLIEYLRSLANDGERAIFYRKAMSAKVSFDDIFTLDSLFQKLGTDTSKLTQNKLVDKVFNVKLEEGAGAFNKKMNTEGKTNIEKNLWKGDFRFNGMKEYIQEEKKALVNLFEMVHYKKYRGKYIQEVEWNKLKSRDLLKKGNIISIPTTNGIQKAKVISSDFNNLKVIVQHDGKYTEGNIITIPKKDIEKLGEVKILNKQ